jgi:hypothetical protein
MDVVLNMDFEPFILEFNLMPGMKSYCNKDKNMRTNMYNGLINIFEEKYDKNGPFIRI